MQPRRTAVWLAAAGLVRATMSLTRRHTGGRHRLRSLGCSLSELPPMLITDLGNQFFIFVFFRTFKIENRQYPFILKRNQPRFWAVKLYEVWAVLPPIPAPVLPPNNRPNRRVVRPQNALILPAGIRAALCSQGCKRMTSNHALLIQRSEICNKKPYTLVCSC